MTTRKSNKAEGKVEGKAEGKVEGKGKGKESPKFAGPVKAFTGPYPRFLADKIEKAESLELLSRNRSKENDGASFITEAVEGIGKSGVRLPRATILRYAGDDNGIPAGVYLSSEVVKHYTPRLDFSNDLTEAVGRVKYGVTIFYLASEDIAPLVEAEYASKSGPSTTYALERTRSVLEYAAGF